MVHFTEGRRLVDQSRALIELDEIGPELTKVSAEVSTSPMTP